MNIKNLSVALVTLFAASAAQAQQAVQWRVDEGGNGHWYQVMSNPAGVQHWTFAGAKSFAESRGGHLAMFENLAESAALHALLQVSAVSPSSAVWVGLYQDRTASDYSEPAGGWRWVDGRQLHFNPWLPWEPTNACNWQPNAPQDWGAWTEGSAGSGRLDDMGDPFPNCDIVVWFCAIEWSADCNGDGIVDYGQILQGQLVDADANGVPDVCEVDPCPGDITGGGFVDAIDLSILLAFWGSTGGGEFDADVNNDGIIEGADLSIVLVGWGPCPQ